jgi:class 3 adenylate cyclase
VPPAERPPTPWPGVAAVALAGLLFAWTSLAERADLFALDQSFGILRAAGPKPAPDDIVIVGLDEATEKAIGEPLALWHAPLGEALARIASAKPKAIGLDVTLPEKSFDSIRPGLDLALARGLAAARAVQPFVVALAIDGQGEAKTIHAPFLAVVDDQRMGLALFGRDIDGVTRRYLLALPTQDGSFPTFAGRLCTGLSKNCRQGITDYALGLPYRYVSLARVLEMKDPAGLARLFGDRIVLVGETQRFSDRIAQPVNLAGWEPPGRKDAPGVLAHAQALRTALHGAPIEPAHPATLVFLLSACALLLAIRDWRAAFVAGVLATTGLLAGSVMLLRGGTHLPIAAALLTVFLAVAVRAALDALQYRRARDRLSHAFGGYVSPPVLEGILAGRIEPGHRAAKRTLAFLFADLRGSTSFTEKSSPEEAMALLNRFHDVAVAAVHKHEGFLDNIRGDGVMAVFGAPKAIDDPSGAAFRAAEDLLRGIDHLNAQRAKRNEPPLEVGVGLAAGEGVVGHVGSRERFNFTAVADAANVAARLQDEAKRLGYRAVLSGPVREKAGAAQLEALGPLELRGHDPVEAWGWKGP